jgi:hypothetical protein
VRLSQEWVQSQLTPIIAGPLSTLLDQLAAAAAAGPGGSSSSSRRRRPGGATTSEPRSSSSGRSTRGATEADASGSMHGRNSSSSRNAPGNASFNVTDATAMIEAHVAAVAGACTAIGMRYAGSSSAAAEQLLRHYVLQLLAAKRRMGVGVEAGVAGGRGRLDKGFLETAVCNVVVALSCVMAGSGHLPTLRLLQLLR